MYKSPKERMEISLRRKEQKAQGWRKNKFLTGGTYEFLTLLPEGDRHI